MSRLKNFGRRAGMQGARVLVLIGLIGLSGIVIGLAASYPLQFIEFSESSAVRLDQTALAGRVDPSAALVAPDDLPTGWSPGDPAASAFGVLGSSFCGDEVPLPTALSDVESVVYANGTDRSTLIAQAVRVDRWQSAREYVDDVRDALDGCEEFYKVGFGVRQKVLVKDAGGKLVVTDSVRAAFVSADGSSVAEWSIMAVGDVLVGISHNGPTRPSGAFLNGVEEDVLARVAPADFAPGGVATETTGTGRDGSGSTVLEGGSADESGDTGGTGGGEDVPPPAPTTTAPATTAPAAPTTTAATSAGRAPIND